MEQKKFEPVCKASAIHPGISLVELVH